MKEQGKNPPDQINEEEIGNLPEKEFRVMTVKMIQNLESSDKLIFSLFLEHKFVLDLGPLSLMQPLLRMFFVKFRWQPLSHSLAFEPMSPPQGSLHGLLRLKQHPTVPLYPITLFHFVQALTCYLKIPV